MPLIDPARPLTPSPSQAALGYVAERSEGFVDLDSLPEDGASTSEVLRFVLSPEARDLRPLLVSWLATGADLLIRDRARKALAAAPALAPRLPFLGPLPLPPAPPVPVPGVGLMPLDAAVDLLAPPLDAQGKTTARARARASVARGKPRHLATRATWGRGACRGTHVTPTH